MLRLAISRTLFLPRKVENSLTLTNYVSLKVDKLKIVGAFFSKGKELRKNLMASGVRERREISGGN